MKRVLKSKIVTGYVPILGHPRPVSEYGKLGEALGAVAWPKQAFYERVEDCWMYKFLKNMGGDYTHSVGDNPQKNSEYYHIVQYQKAQWLRAAMLDDVDSDVFVWIDYGFMRLKGVTAAVIEDFMRRLDAKTIAIPGCWDQYPVVTDEYPCWRFCGGVLVVPREFLMAFVGCFKAEAMRHTAETRNLSWEVNTLARLEQKTRLPIRWYKADHNSSMVENY
jgi:hypothetical protein